MTSFTPVTAGLRFPEGPIAMSDGSVVLVEIERGTLSRVAPDGTVSVIAETGGGPNGAALGPDGKVYICNNGGFTWGRNWMGLTAIGTPADYAGGWIERVDLKTGAIERLYTHADDRPLRGPNDIVFDREGGFWFTDLGKFHGGGRDYGMLCYGRPDGSSCIVGARPMVSPNGVGLSPDERTVYVAESATARLFAFDLDAPGRIRRSDPRTPHGGRMIYASPTWRSFDSLAVDAEGNVCVASIGGGGIVVVAPDGSHVETIETDDPMTTNICFGGTGLRTAYITLSGSGRLVSTEWRRPGLPLNFLNT
jgi:gluconolactonase